MSNLLNVSGIAKSMRDDPYNANVTRLMKAAFAIADGKQPEGWDPTARDVSDLMQAVAMSKMEARETVAHAFGRLLIAGDSMMVKLYTAHDVLLRSGRHGNIYGAAA